jgi:hypothetical protein
MMKTRPLWIIFPSTEDPSKPHTDDNVDHPTARKKIENLKIEGGAMS